MKISIRTAVKQEKVKIQVGRATERRHPVWDMLPKNVLIDNDGEFYVIDAECLRIK